MSINHDCLYRTSYCKERTNPPTIRSRSYEWQALSEEQQDEFAPVCPDFVVELRSSKDRLTTLKKKMIEYLDNGAQLGWLFEPKTKQVFIYRPNQPVECLDDSPSISGDPVLRGFEFDPREIW